MLRYSYIISKKGFEGREERALLVVDQNPFSTLGGVLGKTRSRGQGLGIPKGKEGWKIGQ